MREGGRERESSEPKDRTNGAAEEKEGKLGNLIFTQRSPLLLPRQASIHPTLPSDLFSLSAGFVLYIHTAFEFSHIPEC